jgi:hypothetical protein
MASVRRRLRGALLCSILPLCVAAPRVAHADDAVTITPEARERFAAGVNLLKDPEGPRYEEAYREFKAAYAASPSYKILGNLGLCAMKLERDDEAIVAYEKYLTHAKDIEPSELSQVKTDLATLKSGVVYVTVTSDPPGAKIVDSRLPVRGDRVTNVYGPITQPTRLGVRQGSHQIIAKLDGYPDVTWEVDAPAGELAPHTFTFKKAEVEPSAPLAPQPAPETPKPEDRPKVESRPIPVGVWVGVAATGVLAIGGVVTGVMALGKHSDFQSDNNGQNPSQAQSDKNAGQTLNVVNDVFVGGAIVAAGVTVVLYAMRPTVVQEAKASPAQWRLTPLVSSSGGGLGLSGPF